MQRCAPQQNRPLVVPLAYARPLLDELARIGGDPGALWRSAAITTPLQAVLNGTVASLPAAEFSRLYRGCAVEIEWRCCAREGRRPLGKSAVDMLCYCVIHCTTLREAIFRAAEFNAMMEERGGRLALVERAGIARFSMEVPGRGRDNAALLIDATGLFFYYRLFSWLIGRRLPLLDVGVVHAAPQHPLPLLDAFDLPLQFNQRDNAMSFAARCLDLRVVRSYAELSQIIDYFPFDLALGRAGQNALGDRVRLFLLDSLQHRHQLPALSTVAQLFHMSPATLRRRLAREGTSYVELRTRGQREIAENLLKQTTLPMEDIAMRLGFGGDRAFRRAFREWTGDTPAAYRERTRIR